MSTMYSKASTALLFVDPYNDFLADGGKLWPMVSEVAGNVRLHDNLRAILARTRELDWTICVVPHHRAEPDEMANWKRATPYQRGASAAQVFAKNSWGGEWHPDYAPWPQDLIAKEHWGGSGFANTDLDILLKQRDITHVILIGLIANTCIETTGRYASELGYHVTLVRDATAAFSAEAMRCAHDINGPTFAHAIVTSAELLEQMK